MRSYHQYCGLAKALDVVGDRWTLLIVREFLLVERSRYTDLQKGLPGIATNMLSDRLRELEEAGIVGRESAPPPVATTLYYLTPRGTELEPVVHALGRWGGPLMSEPATGDAFRSHWLALPAKLYLTDNTPQRRPVTIEVRAGDEPMIIEAGHGAVRIIEGAAKNPDAVLSGPPDVVAGVFSGRLSLTRARARGLHYEGDPEILRRVQPRLPRES
jgi:DNA-binding HxlR family transcriptional regulator